MVESNSIADRCRESKVSEPCGPSYGVWSGTYILQFQTYLGKPV